MRWMNCIYNLTKTFTYSRFSKGTGHFNLSIRSGLNVAICCLYVVAKVVTNSIPSSFIYIASVTIITVSCCSSEPQNPEQEHQESRGEERTAAGAGAAL